jgi:hypothetical protein
MHKILLSISLLFVGNLIFGSNRLPAPNRSACIPVAAQAHWAIFGKHNNKSGYFNPDWNMRTAFESAISLLNTQSRGCKAVINGVSFQKIEDNIFSANYTPNNRTYFICAEQHQINVIATLPSGALALISRDSGIQLQIDWLQNQVKSPVPLMPEPQHQVAIHPVGGEQVATMSPAHPIAPRPICAPDPIPPDSICASGPDKYRTTTPATPPLHPPVSTQGGQVFSPAIRAPSNPSGPDQPERLHLPEFYLGDWKLAP